MTKSRLTEYIWGSLFLFNALEGVGFAIAVAFAVSIIIRYALWFGVGNWLSLGSRELGAILSLFQNLPIRCYRIGY